MPAPNIALAGHSTRSITFALLLLLKKVSCRWNQWRCFQGLETASKGTQYPVIYDPTTRARSNYAQPGNSIIVRFDGLSYSHAFILWSVCPSPHTNRKMPHPDSQMIEQMPFTATVLQLENFATTLESPPWQHLFQTCQEEIISLRLSCRTPVQPGPVQDSSILSLRMASCIIMVTFICLWWNYERKSYT